MSDITQLIKDNNFAGIMRACLTLLDQQHPSDPKIAYLHNVNLRAHVQATYNAQPLRKDRDPIPVACIAAAVHAWLIEGKSASTILLVPQADLLFFCLQFRTKVWGV